MGQCYSVEAKFIFKNDPASFCDVIKKEIESTSARFHLIHEEMDTPLKCFENVTNKCSLITTDNVFCTEFDASYGWERVMFDIFLKAMKVLADGSWVTVWPDNGCWTIRVRNGEIEVIDGEDDEDEAD